MTRISTPDYYKAIICDKGIVFVNQLNKFWLYITSGLMSRTHVCRLDQILANDRGRHRSARHTRQDPEGSRTGMNIYNHVNFRDQNLTNLIKILLPGALTGVVKAAIVRSLIRS